LEQILVSGKKDLHAGQETAPGGGIKGGHDLSATNQQQIKSTTKLGIRDMALASESVMGSSSPLTLSPYHPLIMAPLPTCMPMYGNM
jgi:hypothetical protein